MQLAGPVLLEPIASLEVTVPTSNTGDMVGVVGAHGGANTTCLYMARGLVPRHERTVNLVGEDVSGLVPQAVAAYMKERGLYRPA